MIRELRARRLGCRVRWCGGGVEPGDGAQEEDDAAALAFELFEEAFTMGGAVRAGLGLLAGAATFVAVDTALDRYVSGKSGPEQREVVASGARSGVGLALLAAVTLDGVPENLALGYRW